jgi:hypothetical protein
MKRMAIVISLMTVVAMLGAEPALAGATTSLTMNIEDKTVHRRQTIKVDGRLRSPRAACRANQTVELWIDGGLYQTTTTDGEGNYSFRVSPPHPVGRHRFQTRFPGNDTCDPAQSDPQRVRVRRRA